MTKDDGHVWRTSPLASYALARSCAHVNRFSRASMVQYVLAIFGVGARIVMEAVRGLKAPALDPVPPRLLDWSTSSNEQGWTYK